MTIITRYLAKEYFRAAAACLTVSLVLFLLIDFVERADSFIRNHASAGEIGLYYLYRVPGIFIQVSPVAVLLAVLITVALRARANELTAMFSSGASLIRVCAPVLFGCAAIAVLSFVASESVAPAATRRAREIETLRIPRGKFAAQFTANRYWIRGENAILSAQVIDPSRGALFGFEYLGIDRDFRLLRRIDAREAVYEGNGAWRLRDGREWAFQEGGLAPRPFAGMELRVPETIEGFLKGETTPEEMTYAQLARYTRDSRARGYDVRRYEVDLNAKLSYPLLSIVVGFLGIPFALRSPRKGGLWRSIGGGLLIGFLCWIALSASLSFGRKGLLPPAAAAWLPDALIAALSVPLFRFARR